MPYPDDPVPFFVRRLTRRTALRSLGALGLGAAGAAALSGTGIAVGDPARGGRGAARFQQGTPGSTAGTPPPRATPALGPRPDGTRVWRVQVGGGSEADQTEVMAFLPDAITVNVGDALFFDIQGFHTATFLSGAPRLPVLIPDPAPGTPAATPPAGTPQLIINPAAAFPSGGDHYDGTGVVNSGVPLDPSAPPFTVTFTKEGTFEVACLVHPKMKGKVIVQAKGTALPHEQAAYDQMIEQTLAQAVTQGKTLVAQHAQASATPGPGGATRWEVTVGTGNDQLMVARFLPDRLAIKQGDTVRWKHGGGGDPHTVTFLGGSPAPEDTIVVPQSGGPPKLVQSPTTFFPRGGAVFSGTGYHNSGYLGVDPSLVGWSGYQPHDSYELTFDTPGEFAYYCILHSESPTKGMNAKIVVS